MRKLSLILLVLLAIYSCSKKNDVTGSGSPENTSKADTLVTYKFPGDGVSGFLPNAYLVATDSSGNIISEVKTQIGTSVYKLYTPKIYSNARLNVYEIDVPTDPTAQPIILGYLQIKKGSIYDTSVGSSTPSNYPLNIHFKNASAFDQLTLSTDLQSNSITNIADTVQYRNLAYSNNSKIWLQIQKNNKTLYNFFDVTKGTHDLNIDFNQCNKVPQVRNMTAPGSFFSMYVYAKPNKNNIEEYFFGQGFTLSNTLSYYYPTETFEQYSTRISYYLNSARQYTFVNVGATVPTQIDTYNADFKNTGSSLADYKTTVSGSYDYYMANFIGNNISNSIYIELYSPSVANYRNYKLPDFSKYIDKKYLDPTKIVFQNFMLSQVDGFNESKLPYKIASSHDVNMKTVEGR